MVDTTTPASYKFIDNSKKITLVDTPGFDDATRPDVEILTEMAKVLVALHNSKIRLAGIIYLHRITDPRFSGTAVKNLEVLQRLCGPSNFGSVVLVMNMWNAIDTNIAAQRQSELRDTFWASMHKGGSSMHPHTGTAESALDILHTLTDNAKSPLILALQHELAVEGKILEATAAGEFVQKEMLEAKRKHEEDLVFLKSSMEDAIREKDESLLCALREERSAAEAKLKSATGEQERLSVTAERLQSQDNYQQTSRLLFGETQTDQHPPLVQPEHVPASTSTSPVRARENDAIPAPPASQSPPPPPLSYDTLPATIQAANENENSSAKKRNCSSKFSVK